MPDRILVHVDGRQLELSNLDKVLYPAAGYTRGEIIDYYTRVSPVLRPHIQNRPLTRIRYPNGVDGNSFFEKNAPAGVPPWVRVETLPAPGSTRDRETLDYVVADDLPTLVYLANLAALELHVPQWKVGSAGPDRLVVDLDTVAPAGLAECSTVAVLVTPPSSAPPFRATLTLDPARGKPGTNVTGTFRVNGGTGICRMRVTYTFDGQPFDQDHSNDCTS